MKKLLEVFVKRGVEKAILFIAVLTFLAYFVLGFVLGSKDRDLDELNQKSQNLKTVIEMATKESVENLTSTYSSTLTVWNGIPNFTNGSNWIAYRRPEIKREEKPAEKKVVDVLKPQVLATPQFTALMAQVGKISIDWKDTFASNEEYVSVLPSSYRVDRKVGGEKEYKTLATLDASTRTYTDISIQPKTTYFYRIAALSNTLEGKVSEEKSIKSAGVFTIIFKGTAGNMAMVKVIKFEAAKQKSYEKFFHDVKKDGEIGEKEQVPDFTKGNIKIDFNTGYKVKGWGEEKVVVNDMVCKNPNDPNHQPQIMPKEIKGRYLIYIDDEGNEKKVWQDDKEPQGNDRRCPNHKGLKPAQAPKPVQVPKQDEAKSPQESDKKTK